MSQSAFIVRVPEAERHVGALRELHDPVARLGVPAHVTILHPFMAPERIDAAVVALAGAVAAAAAPFAFRLDRIRRFAGVLYLAPEPAEPFVALTLALARAFPDHPPYGGRHADIVPHLTVAQAEPDALDAAELALRATLLRLGGIAAGCSELSLIENASGRWRPMRGFALGTASASAR